MICFFVKTKATDDTRSISSPFTRSPLSFRVPFPLFFPSLPSLPHPERREPRAREADGARFFVAVARVARAKRVGGKLFAAAVLAAESEPSSNGGRRVKSESPSIPF